MKISIPRKDVFSAHWGTLLEQTVNTIKIVVSDQHTLSFTKKWCGIQCNKSFEDDYHTMGRYTIHKCHICP